MIKTFTRKVTFLPVFSLLWIFQLVLAQSSYGQCSASTPVFTVNLAGQPAGVWTSPEVNRNGVCCTTVAPEKCVQFDITLDALAGGLQFDISSGPVPSGSMSYQVNCGPNIPVGQPVCVTGPGPHKLTICMPGNAANSFRVQSVPAFTPVPDISVTAGCFATLRAPIAFKEESIVWKDLTGGGMYDKYLSCTTGCANPILTPGDTPPPYVDYSVCGASVASECATLPFCDIVRVYFYPAPTIAISPFPAILCPGSPGVELQGTVSGSSGPFSYFWTDASGNLLATTEKMMATAPGTYHLEVRNQNYPDCRKFTQSVEVVTDLAANAGPDQWVCSLNPVQLAGTVRAASGGIWSGGAGAFSPANTDLNAVYMPTEAEIQAGSLTLALTSTGNGSCTAVRDEVKISFYQVQVALAGTAVVCPGSAGSITATVTGGRLPLAYLWNTGETTAGISNKPPGTYTVTIRDASGCSVAKSFTIAQGTNPGDLAAEVQAATCGKPNGILTVTGVTGGTAPYSFSRDGLNFQASPTFSGLAAGTYSIRVKDASGCSYAESFQVNPIAGPNALSASASPATCLNNDGSITAGTVSGGTAPYTYSINGSTFQSATVFQGLAAGSYTVTAKDASGCVVTAPVTVGRQEPVSFTASTTPSTCGGANGSLAITGVTGGLAPYAYSKDGGVFQASASFGSLLPGTYTITVKDARGCTYAGPVVVGNIAGATDLAAATRPATCSSNNGELTITSVTGGMAPYLYSLDGLAYQAEATFRNLAAGEHQVYVKDARACVYTEGVLLNNDPAPSFTALASAATCGGSNGTIQVTANTGGAAPFSYSLEGGSYQATGTFTGLVAGSYTLTIKDANGCLFSRSLVVENIAGPSAFESGTTAATCGGSNGSITITGVTGGTAPFAYSRDGGNYQASATFAGLPAGDHLLSVKDATGCTITQKVMLENISGPADMAARAQPSICGSPNGELTVTEVTGGTEPYSYSRDGVYYQPSPTFGGLAAGQYTLRVKDARGCVLARTFALTNVAGPTALGAVSRPATCANDNGSIEAGEVTGGTAPYVYALDGVNFQAAAAFTGLAAGAYTLTAKDARGCLVTTPVRVGLNVPAGFTSTTTAAACGSSNGSLTITAVTGGTSPYAFSRNGEDFQAGATFGNLVPGTYTITVKDANDCRYTGQVKVLSEGGATDLTAALKAPTCSERNGELTVTAVTGGEAPYTFSLDGSLYQASNLFSSLPAGAYQVYVKDARGCVYAEELQLNNIPGPTFIAQARAATCGNSNGELEVTSVSGGTASFTYSLNAGPFQTAAVFRNLAPGRYTITVKDANGCLFSRPMDVEDLAGVSGFTATTEASRCGAGNGGITISEVAGGLAPYAYSLNGGAFQASATFSNLAGQTYTVTVQDARGCRFVRQVDVPEQGGVTALSTAVTPSSCTVPDGSISILGQTGGTAPYTYSLAGSPYQSAPAFTALAPALYQLSVRDASGCVKTFDVAVLSKGPRTADLEARPADCGKANGAISIGQVSGGIAPLAYSLNGGAFQPDPAFANLAAGAYTLTIRDAQGCMLALSQVVGSAGGPEDFLLTGTDASCGNKNGRIAISQVRGGASPYAYSLDGTSYQQEPAFTGLADSTYQVHVKDALGCLLIKSIVIGSSAPLTGLQVTAVPAGCGQPTGQVLIGEVTGGVGPYSFSLDGLSFTDSRILAQVAPGSYQVTVRDAANCRFSVPVRVELRSSQLAYVQDASCQGSTNGVIALRTRGGGPGTTYSLDNGLNFQPDSVFTNLPKGLYQVLVRFSESCQLTLPEIEVKEGEPISVQVTPLAKALDGQLSGSAAITAITGGKRPFTFQVDQGSWGSDTVFTQLSGGQHTLLVKDQQGCTASMTFTVGALQEIEIPNGFTPNGDGLNDLWVLKNLSALYPQCRVMVYNRWGVEVFRSAGYPKEWDGTLHGKPLPDGTYYCIIELGNGEPALRKSVSILR